MVIARAARNPFLLETIGHLVARMSEIGFRDMLGVEDFEPLLGIHQPIYEAIAAHDPRAARRAMARHFDELRKTVAI